MEVVDAIYDGFIDTPKTEKSARVVPLPISTMQLLERWRTKSRRNKPDDFILQGRKGVPGDQARMLRDHIKPICDDLGFRRATWLTFRRSWTTWADGKGISPKMRGALMGNSEEINSRIYTKVIPDTLRKAMEMVGMNCALIVRLSPKR